MSQFQLPNGWHFVGTTDDNRPTETDMGDTPIARIGFGQILEMPGDVITVRRRSNLLSLYSRLAAEESGEPLDWVTFDADTLRATVQGLPSASDISLPVDVNTIVEFLSR